MCRRNHTALKLAKSCSKSVDRLDGLSSWPLRQRRLELLHSQLDDLVFVLLVLDGHGQPFHVKLNLHVFKLSTKDKTAYALTKNSFRMMSQTGEYY